MQQQTFGFARGIAHPGLGGRAEQAVGGGKSRQQLGVELRPLGGLLHLHAPELQLLAAVLQQCPGLIRPPPAHLHSGLDVGQIKACQQQSAGVGEPQLAAALEAHPGQQHPLTGGTGALMGEAAFLQALQPVDRAGGVDEPRGGGKIADAQIEQVVVDLRCDRPLQVSLASGAIREAAIAGRNADPAEAVGLAIAAVLAERPQGVVAAEGPAAALQHQGGPFGLEHGGIALGRAQAGRHLQQLLRRQRIGVIATGQERIEPQPVAQQQIRRPIAVLVAPHRRERHVVAPEGAFWDQQFQGKGIAVLVAPHRRERHVGDAVGAIDRSLQDVGPGLEAQGAGTAGAPAGLQQLVAERGLARPGDEGEAGVELGLEAIGITTIAGGIATHHLRTGGGSHTGGQHGDLAEAGAGLIEAGYSVAIEILGAGGIEVEGAAGDCGVDAHDHPTGGGFAGGFAGIEQLLHQLPAAGIHHIAHGAQAFMNSQWRFKGDEIKRPRRLLRRTRERQRETAIAVAVDPHQIVAPGIRAFPHPVARGTRNVPILGQRHRHGRRGGDQQFVLVGGQQAIGIADLQGGGAIHAVGAQQVIAIEIDAPDRQLQIDPLLDRAAGGDQQLQAIVRVVVEIEPLAAAKLGAQQPEAAPVLPVASGGAVGGDGGDLADLGLNCRQVGGAVGVAGHALGHRDPLALGEHRLARFGHQPVGGHVLFVDVVATDGVLAHVEEAGQHLIGVAIDQRQHAHAAVEQLVGGVALAQGDPEFVLMVGIGQQGGGGRGVGSQFAEIKRFERSPIEVGVDVDAATGHTGRQCSAIAPDVLAQQIDRLNGAQIAHKLAGELGDGPVAPLQIDRAEAQPGREIDHIRLDRIEIERKANLAAASRQRHLADAQVEGVQLTGDGCVAVIQPAAGAVVAAGVEVPHQVGAGPRGQLIHHTVGAAAVEHEAAAAIQQGRDQRQRVVINAVLVIEALIAPGLQGCAQLILTEVLTAPGLQGVAQLGLADGPQAVAHQDVAVDAAHQPVETEGAHVGGGVVEPQQELQGCGAGCGWVDGLGRFREEREAVGRVGTPVRALRSFSGEQHVGAQGPEQGVVAGAAGQHIAAGVVLPRPGTAEQDWVVGVVADELVVAGTTNQQIVADATPELIVAITAIEGVIAVEELLLQVEGGLIAVEHVVASAAEQQIAADAALQQVGATSAEQPVVAGPALEAVFIDGAAQGRGVLRIGIELAQQVPLGIGELAPVLHAEPLLQPAQGRRLAAGSQREQRQIRCRPRIAHSFAEDLLNVERFGALERATASMGQQGGEAGEGFALVVEVAEQPVVAVASHQLVLAGTADQQIGARPPEQLVGALGTGELVVAFVAVELVVAAAALQLVVAAATAQQVGPGATDQAVIARAALQQIIALIAEQPVVAGLAEQVVVVDAAHQQVVAITAFEAVVAGTAFEGVAAAAAPEQIVAALATQQVVAVITLQQVVASAAQQGVVARATAQGVVSAAAVEQIDAAAALEQVVARLTLQGVVAGIATQGVVAAAAAQQIVALPTTEQVFTATPFQAVVAIVAVEGVVAAAAAQQVVVGAAAQQVVAIPTLEGVVAEITMQLVVARIAEDAVVAGAAVDAVVAIAAAQQIVARLTEDQVVASAAFRGVVAGTGGDRVVAGVAAEQVGAGIAHQQVVAVAAAQGVGVKAEHGAGVAGAELLQG